MAEIFGCKGVCEKCEASDVCPMKGEFEKKFQQKISGIQVAGKSLLDSYLNLVGRLDPPTIIRINGINLCNLLRRIEILAEIGEITSVRDVKKQLFGAIKKEKRQLLELKHYSPIKARVLLFLEEMVSLIFSTLQKECPAENCQNCWLKEECPQLTAQANSPA